MGGPSHILGFGGAMRPPRGSRCHRTRTGLEIGSAYTRPPPVPSADAERIQAALLAAAPRRAPHRVATALMRWLRRGAAK